MAKSVKRGPRIREIGSSVLSSLKPMNYEIDTWCVLARHLAITGQSKDGFTQSQDNVTEWDIGLWC